jgi:hypothetical protein
MDGNKEGYTPDFSVAVQGVRGLCPAGEAYAKFFAPHSAMARWVKTAEQTVMIDGCFLKCHGVENGEKVSSKCVDAYRAPGDAPRLTMCSVRLQSRTVEPLISTSIRSRSGGSLEATHLRLRQHHTAEGGRS